MHDIVLQSYSSKDVQKTCTCSGAYLVWWDLAHGRDKVPLTFQGKNQINHAGTEKISTFMSFSAWISFTVGEVKAKTAGGLAGIVVE